MAEVKETYTKKAKKTPRVRAEATEMKLIDDWREKTQLTHPQAGLLFHPSNETSWRGAKKQCILHGVPDLVLPVPRNGYGALYIELKREVGGVLAPHQADILEKLNMVGNLAMVCKGHKEAILAMESYLGISTYLP